MTPLIALAAGGAAFVLIKRSQGPASTGETAPEKQEDPHATLSGPDGAQSTATAGGPVTAFPAVGSGGATGAFQTAPSPKSAKVAVTAARPTSSGSRALTQTLQAKRPLLRDRACGTCSETQSAIDAATRGIAPDLIF